MKKLLTLLLALAMVFCLVSCENLPDSFQSAFDSVKGKCENLYEDVRSTVDSAIDKVKDALGIEPSCKHNWIGATCTAPKTCSVCGATDGVANGHTEETVAGTASTCTEAGMTDGKKCAVCGEITVEQTATSALGHTEETIAGTPATCTEAGITDGKKCTVCGETTVEQTVIDALGHKAGKDDGDVTTPVKCANEGCDEIMVPAKDAIALTIPTFENGAVVTDKMNYAIGDTVKLTINPDWGYAQKLYIDGEPLMLPWNNNVYTFVAEKDTYVISGTFEFALDMAAGDVTRWDYINQGHGVVTTYYPNNNDAWWFQINGEYKSFSITAKNYRDVENSYENGPDGGWRIALYMKLDNGNYYAFSMWIDANHKYAYNHFGGKIAGDKDSVTTWGGAWHDLAVTNAEATAALNGDGAEFKLERIDGNHIQVTFGGVVLETYEIPGVTVENKVVSVGLHHWGNKGAYVDIPFAVTAACNHTWMDATCTAPKTCSTCNVTVGEKLDHTYTNYVSNDDATCLEDGTKTATCVCGEKNTIADEGSALGHTEETVAGKDATCTETGLTEGKKCSVCGEITVKQNEIPVKGHKDDDNNYECDDCDAKLCTNHIEEVVAGKDATCTEIGLTEGKKCSICGSAIIAQEIIPALGHKAGADDGDCTTAVKCANAGCDYIFVVAKEHTPEADDGDVTTAVKCANEGCDHILVSAKEAIDLTIPALENGTVTADKMNYAIGDTVTLTIAPAKDYAQKLYINGEVLLVNANGEYSFVVEENTYEITGEFVYVKGNWYWTAEYGVLNQAHGVFHSPKPAGGEKNGELVPTYGKYDGGKVLFKDPSHGTKQDYAIVLKMHFSDGQKAEVRIVNKDGNGHYMVQSMSGMLGSWKWYYDLNDEENAAVANGEGVWFGLVRDGADIKITVNGSVKTRSDVTVNVPADVVLDQFKITTFNFSYAIDVHYEFTRSCEHTWVNATCTAPKTCSTCNVTVGEKLEHTYTNYESNNDATCTEDGTKTGTCVCGDKNTIADEGSALGHNEETVPGKTPTCTETGVSDGKKCSVCGVTTVEQNEIPANGHKDDDGDYKCDVCESNLCTDHIEEAVASKPATCTESGLTEGKRCANCGSIILAQEVIPAKGHTANADDGDCTTAVKCANAGCDYIFVAAMEHAPAADDGDVTTAVKCTNEGCDYTFVEAKEAIALNIPAFENGAVTTDKMNYAAGDTVTLTIAPAAGHFQKLYINGEPLMLGWKTFTYSFVATEDVYEITGSFEQGLSLKPGDWGRWDDHNQLHGVLNTYYPNNGDSWWMDINGEYQAIEITAKNYLPLADSMDGNGQNGYHQILRFGLSNGKTYAFRIYNDKGTYAVSCIEVSGSVNGWGNWKNINNVLGYSINDAMNGDGVQFKIERTSANVITVSVNNVVMFTYTMDGVTEADKVTYVGIQSNRNSGKYVEVPFKLTVPTPVQPEPPVEDQIVTIGKFANGSVTADKDSYNVGDTVTLTVAPAKDYAQKLYINGEALLVDTNSKYSFVVEEGKTYDITGEFVYVKGNWYWTAEYILLNQAHGVFHSPVPAGGEKNGELVPTADKYCGGKVLVKDPSHGTKKDFAIVLKMQFSDGQKAEIRLVNKDGNGHYMVQSMSGMFGSWKWYYDLNDAENAAVANGEGVWFGLVRYGTEIELSINGKVIPHRADTPISLAESTVLNQFKVTTFNFSYAVDVHYEFYMNGSAPVKPEPPVEDDAILTIGEFANGSVTADKDSYNVGDTVTLTVAAAKDYAQKLYINGEPLLVDTNSKYSFVIEEGKTYDITGEFVSVKGDWYWTNNGEFGLLNQAHGIINVPAHAGKDATGELVPTLDKCYGGKVLVKDPFNGTKQDYAIVLKMQFSDGTKAEIRLVNKDGKGHYMVQSMSGLFGSWKWYYDLNDAENAAVANGEGVWFGLVREGTDIKISVNGSVKTRTDVTVNVPENVVLNQFKVQAYNFDKAVDIKYEFYMYE